MENIEDLLKALVGDDSEECEECQSDHTDLRNDDEGLFSGIDPEMLIKLMGIFQTLEKPDDTERFLLSLKPLLRPENRPKIDFALKILKLLAILPILKDEGILNSLL